jgi:hypothetical protein
MGGVYAKNNRLAGPYFVLIMDSKYGKEWENEGI